MAATEKDPQDRISADVADKKDTSIPKPQESISHNNSSANTQTPQSSDRQFLRSQERALLRAIRRGNTSTARTLLSAGVSPDGKYEAISPISQCIRYSRLDILHLLFQHQAHSPHRRREDFDFEDHLLLAAYKGNLGILKYLYDYRRAEAAKYGRNYVHVTPEYMTGAELIHAVATNKHTKCIEFILAQEPNRESQIEWTAWFMQTPLHFAIDRPRVRVAVVRYLLERGAEIDEVTSDGMTAIYLAAKHGHEGVVRELLKRSPRLDLKGGFRQRTVLHQAAEHCSLKVVNMLVEAGADVYARDKDGMTVLEYARKGRQRETVELVSSTFGLETLIEQAI